VPKHRVSLILAIGVCAAANAAEIVATAPSPAAAPAQASATAASAPAPIQAPAAVPSKKPSAKPLDLRIGDVRKYMMPNEFREAISAPDADKNTVVVEAKRELLPVKYDDPIPVGTIMAPIWALMHPTQSWRILVPDLNRPPDGPPDVVPPPIFRWGP
jgi:hypothetical protein